MNSEGEEDLSETELSVHEDENYKEEKSEESKKKYSCSDCDLNFSKSAFLKQHIKSVHEGKKLITRYKYESETGLSYRKASFKKGKVIENRLGLQCSLTRIHYVDIIFLCSYCIF